MVKYNNIESGLIIYGTSSWLLNNPKLRRNKRSSGEFVLILIQNSINALYHLFKF